MSVATEDLADLEEDNIDDMYLVFRIAHEQYAVEIVAVTEIIGLQKIIEVPDVPAYVRGVINLRGQVIPVMDVRLRFNLKNEAYTDRTVIIVLEVDEVKTGLVVDGVSDVIEVKPEQVNPPPQWQGGETAGVIKGMARQDEHVSILLDIEKLLYSDAITMRSMEQSAVTDTETNADGLVRATNKTENIAENPDPSDNEPTIEQD